jgi:tetratricopeptide (TPR) repeat protein
VLEQAGDAAAALEVLAAAAPLVDAGGEPRDRWVLGINLLVNLCHLGRHGEAAARLPALAAQTRELGNRLDELRVQWLGGRVAAGLGRRDEARTAFEKVLRGFEEVANGYDAALVGLELAVLQLEAGRTAEVRALAEKMVWIFRSRQVHREALAALTLFRQAAEREQATAGLARRVLAFLEQARHDPDLRFSPAG